MSQTAKFLLTIPTGATGNWCYGNTTLADDPGQTSLAAAVNAHHAGTAATVQEGTGVYSIEFPSPFNIDPNMPEAGYAPDGTPQIPVRVSNVGGNMVGAFGNEVLPSVECVRRNEYSPE